MCSVKRTQENEVGSLAELSQREFSFVEAVVRLLDPRKAALSVGVKPSRVSHYLKIWMGDPRISHAIEVRRSEIAALANVDATWVLQQWMQLATADPGAVVKLRRVNCRYCNGTSHQYQWTPREYAEAVAQAMAKEMMPPAPLGGLDFKHNADPHPDCPDCQGEGVADLHVEDTRLLSGPERLLIAGIKSTREGGIEVKFRDQDAALAKIADFLGMIVKRGEVSGPGGRPLMGGKLPEVVEELPPDSKALASLYRALMSQ